MGKSPQRTPGMGDREFAKPPLRVLGRLTLTRKRILRVLTRLLGWVIGVSASLAAVTLLAIAVFVLFFDYPDHLRRWMEGQASRILDTQVSIENISVDLPNYSFVIQGVRVEPQGDGLPPLTIDSVRGQLSPTGVFGPASPLETASGGRFLDSRRGPWERSDRDTGTLGGPHCGQFRRRRRVAIRFSGGSDPIRRRSLRLRQPEHSLASRGGGASGESRKNGNGSLPRPDPLRARRGGGSKIVSWWRRRSR